MYVKISKTNEYIRGNKFSCYDLVKYLEKENRGKNFLSKECFFDQHNDDIPDFKVIQIVDHHKKGLRSDEAKFYMITVNPSERELRHLAYIASGVDNVKTIYEMNSEVLANYHHLIREYVRLIVMEEYASGFNKDVTAADLIYFGKLEEERYYKGFDHEVKQGLAKSGEQKTGLQTHVHIVVSRNDRTQQVRLSPLANGRAGSQFKLNGKNVRMGIDRVAFFNACEQGFDQSFHFQRDWKTSFAYRHYLNHPESFPLAYVKTALEAMKHPETALQKPALNLIAQSLPNKDVEALHMASLFLQPESTENSLVKKLEQLSANLLPPKIKSGIKIAENVIKPALDLGSPLEP